jgi:hypothetical protein
MKNKVSLALIAFCLLVGTAGCQTSDPNRGTIPDSDVPIKPPSLTNEFETLDREIVIPRAEDRLPV